MDVVTPTLSEIRGRTSEPRTLQVTPGQLDRDEDQSGHIFSGFVGLLSILLVTVVLCVLRNRHKRQKQRVPHLQGTVTPLLALPRSGQQARNVYNLLPWRQQVLETSQSRSICIFSIESPLSRSCASCPSVYTPSRAGSALQLPRAQSLAVSIYDDAPRPPVWGNLAPSANYVNVRAAGGYPSITSEDLRDYVNVPRADEIAEILASTSNAPGDLFVLPSVQELEFAEQRAKGCRDASDGPSFWRPGAESSDPLSDEEGSSETSNDYVDMADLDLGAILRKGPWVSFPCCRDYENVPPADPNGSQGQGKEAMSSNTNYVEVRAAGLGRFLVLEDYVIYPPSAQGENSQMEQGEHRSNKDNKDSKDYDILPAAQLGRDSGQEADTGLLPDGFSSVSQRDRHMC